MNAAKIEKYSCNIASSMDSNISKPIENLDYRILKNDMLCGINPAGGLLKFAKGKGFRIVNLARLDSGGSSGDDSSVVVYGGFILIDKQ